MSKKEKSTKNKFTPALLGGLVALGIIGILLISSNSSDDQSFCEVLSEVNTELSVQTEGTYSVSFLDGRSSDPQTYIDSLSDLEAHAPEAIKPDFDTMIRTFETIDNDPSKALEASLGAIGPERTIEGWISTNCVEPTE